MSLKLFSKYFRSYMLSVEDDMNTWLHQMYEKDKDKHYAAS